jgi:hypothetical protein
MRTAPQSTCDTAPVLEHPNTRSWFGTAHNNALANAAMIETDGDGDAVIDHLSELTLSPMFRLLVEDFKKGEQNAHNDAGFNLAQFAARCFFAGTLYKRPQEVVSA